MKNIAVSASTYPQHKDITLLSVKGFIDTNTAPEFEKTFQACLGEQKFKIIIDLKEVNYISSAGWGIFVGEIKRIRGQKGDLFLVGMSPEVTDAYELLQFNTILKSFPTVEQAVQKGFGRSKAGKGAVAAPMETPAQSQMEKSFEKIPADIKFEEPLSGQGASKPRWFPRILMPWKWF